ncbi:hypothetical protein C1I60_16190 [Paenibacillus terrae]|uniref:Uncharacterized protein n=1 Tax=Paenibacillus terrae TaxID=159743 RepID=A0A4U2Q175_9BACL|nr:hypothetical protein [Paenibacillus terrae]TKH43058.1 hypothetical protein C1I60_16190 [Paenibacillus terrae]
MTKPIAKITSVLEQWALYDPPMVDFTVENVLHAIRYEATYDYVLKFLISRNGFELSVSRVYMCPNNHKAFYCEVDEEIDEYDLPTCHICEQEIVNDLDHSFLVFSFTDEYREDIKKKDLFRLKKLVCH